MDIFTAEVIGTAILILLGDGVVAGVLLAHSKSQNAGWIVITFGWGMAVAVAIYAVGQFSGAQINPAVTISFALVDITPWSDVPKYIAGQFVGAGIGAILVYLAYLPHWGPTDDPGLKLAVFSTGPAIRDYAKNLVTEIIGTMMLVFGVLAIVGHFAASVTGGLGQTALATAFGTSIVPLLIGLLVLVIGLSRRPHGVRDQPGPRPRTADHPRHPADPRQGELGLGLLVGSRRGSHHRRVPRGSALRGAVRTWCGQSRGAGCPERASGVVR